MPLNQYRFHVFRQGSFLRFIADQSEPLVDFHRKREALERALADQVKHRIQLNVHDIQLQRIAVKLHHVPAVALGIREDTGQTRHVRQRQASFEATLVRHHAPNIELRGQGDRHKR